MSDPIAALETQVHPEPPFSRHRDVVLIAGSVVALFVGPWIPRFLRNGVGRPIHIADLSLWVTLGMEIVLAAVWLPVLRRRGWATGQMTRAYANVDVLRGVGLAFTSWFLYVFTYYTVVALWPGFAARATFRLTGAVSWLTVLALLVINPVFEEALYEGYIVNALRRSGWPIALSASIAVRLAIHLYQGPLGFLSELTMGLVFTGYYLRTHRLWPLVAGHVLLDVIGLAPLAHGLA